MKAERVSVKGAAPAADAGSRRAHTRDVDKFAIIWYPQAIGEFGRKQKDLIST
jgi:hypothetical protein